MSWFNAKSFAEGALTELNKQIDINTEEAKTYEEEQRELAKTSRRTISQRRGVVNTLVGVAKELEKLGASKAQIQAAHSSGPSGLMALHKAMMKAMDERGGKKRFMAEHDVSAMITASDMGSEFKEMEYQEFIERSMGLDQSAFGPLEVDPQQNLLQRALGFGDKAAARARLDREIVDGGMSLLDINEAAAQQAYRSAMPGSYATFSPGTVYDTEDALTTWIAAETTINRNLAKNSTYIGLLAEENPAAALKMQRKKFGAFAAAQFEKYGVKAYENAVIDWGSEAVLGPELYTELGLQFGFIDSIESSLEPVLSQEANTVTLSNGIKITTGPNGSVISILLPTSTEPLTNRDTIQDMLTGLRKRNILLPNTSPSIQSLEPTDLDAGPVPGSVAPPGGPLSPEPITGDLVTVFDNMDEAAVARSDLPVGSIVTIAGKKHTVAQAPPREGAIEGMSSTKYFIEVPEDTVPKPKKPEVIVTKPEVSVTDKKRTLADDVGVVYDTFDKVTSFLGDFFSGGDDEGSYVIKIPALGDDYFKVNAETLAIIRDKAPEILLNGNAFVEEFGTQEVDDEDINEYALKTYMPGNNREIIKKLKKLGYEVD